MKMKDKRKLFINILRTVLLIICGTLIGVNVYLINAKTLAGNDLPMPFGYGAAVVLSGSMEPTLSVNDLIIVQEFSTGDMIVVKETEDFDIYDIVVYKSGSSLVVHRIVGIGAEKVVTKGDANNTEDEPITRADVLGKVIFHIPYLGTVISFLKTPVGTIILVGLAILLVEIPHRREVEKDDEEMQKIIDEINRLKDEI